MVIIKEVVEEKRSSGGKDREGEQEDVVQPTAPAAAAKASHAHRPPPRPQRFVAQLGVGPIRDDLGKLKKWRGKPAGEGIT
eukprot:scaffold437_cov168-Ochromonas_danica.AAC.7